MRRRAALALALGLIAAACGSSSGSGSAGSGSGSAGSGSGSPGSGQLTVSAAASLKAAFTTYGAQFTPAKVRYSFAGSDILAAQIEQGLRPDVFASANTQLPDALYAKGLADKPVVFAANRLVLAVAPGSPIHALADVEKPGVSIAIGSPTVPVGIYTRKVLKRLGAGEQRIIANVRSDEPDVSGIVGKLTEGAVQAGFVYATDVAATHGKLVAIALPGSLQPVVAYGVVLIKGSHAAGAAQQFISGLLGGTGRTALLKAGFLPPPA